MPTYQFINKETQEITDHVLKIAELDAFKENNPHLERYFGSPIPVGDPVRLGIRKLDNGFREVMQNIHKGTHGSVLGGNIR